MTNLQRPRRLGRFLGEVKAQGRAVAFGGAVFPATAAAGGVRLLQSACRHLHVETASTSNVLQLRGRFGFNRRLSPLPPQHWSVAFVADRAD